MESRDNQLVGVLKEAVGYISELDAFLKDPSVDFAHMHRCLTAWNNLVESEVLAPLQEILGKKKGDEEPN